MARKETIMECKKPYTITHVADLDVDDLATTPDYFLGVRTVPDESTGNLIYTPVRIPGARVMPTGNLANVIAIATNNSGINIPESQVRAGYVDVQPGGNIVRYADVHHAPMFLMVSNYTNGKVLIQTSGFLTFPLGHQYIKGIQYYLDANGQPTTDGTVTGKKLFRAIDEYSISVNGDF